MLNSISKLWIVLALTLSMGYSQKLLGPVQITAPDFIKDKDGKPAVFKYDLELEPFTDAKVNLSSYQNKNFILFYFSATCPHCKHSAPFLIKFKNENKEKGLDMLAVASGNNRESDIGKFITEQKLDVPVFVDKKRNISDNYGTGSVPVIMLINSKGNFIRIKGFNDNETIYELQAALADTSRF